MRAEPSLEVARRTAVAQLLLQAGAASGQAAAGLPAFRQAARPQLAARLQLAARPQLAVHRVGQAARAARPVHSVELALPRQPRALAASLGPARPAEAASVGQPRLVAFLPPRGIPKPSSTNGPVAISLASSKRSKNAWFESDPSPSDRATRAEWRRVAVLLRRRFDRVSGIAPRVNGIKHVGD